MSKNDKIVKKTPQSQELNNVDGTSFLLHTAKVQQLQPIDMNNPDEVAERVNEYFNLIVKDKVEPSIAGLALALHTPRTRVQKIALDETHPSQKVLLDAVQMLEAYLVDRMSSNGINYVSGIFLLKSCYGYREQQELTVNIKSPFGELQSKEDIAKKYIEATAEEIIDEDIDLDNDE